MTAAERLQVQPDGHRPSRPLRPTIAVNETQQDQLDQLVEQISRRTGERPEDVRRAVEIAVLTRGIDALREELGQA